MNVNSVAHPPVIYARSCEMGVHDFNLAGKNQCVNCSPSELGRRSAKQDDKVKWFQKTATRTNQNYASLLWFQFVTHKTRKMYIESILANGNRAIKEKCWNTPQRQVWFYLCWGAFGSAKKETCNLYLYNIERPLFWWFIKLLPMIGATCLGQALLTLKVEASGRKGYMEMGSPLTFACFGARVHGKAHTPFIWIFRSYEAS